MNKNLYLIKIYNRATKTETINSGCTEEQLKSDLWNILVSDCNPTYNDASKPLFVRTVNLSKAIVKFIILFGGIREQLEKETEIIFTTKSCKICVVKIFLNI